MSDPTREAFERHFRQPPFEWDLTHNSSDPEYSAWPDQYRHYFVQGAWEAWQAALESAPEPEHVFDVAYTNWYDTTRALLK